MGLINPEVVSRRLAFSFIIAMAVIGTVGTIGWITGSLPAFALSHGLVPTAPVAGVVYLLLALCMFIFSFPIKASAASLLSKAILILIIVLGLFSFVAYLIDPNFDIEQFLLPPAGGTNPQSPSISPIAALVFALGSIALLMNFAMKIERYPYSRLPGVIALLVFATGSVGMLGYALGAPELYFSTIRPISIGSSAALIFFGLGIIVVIGPKTWPLFTFFSSRVQDELLRFLLPVIGVIFLIFSWTLSQILPTSKNPALILGIFTIITILLTAVLVQRLSRTIETRVSRAEEGRKIALDDLRQANEKLNIIDSLTRHDILSQISLSISKAELARLQIQHKGALADLDEIVSIDKKIISMLRFSKDYRNLGIEKPKWLPLGEIVSNAILLTEMTGIVAFPDCRGYDLYADPMLEKVFSNLLDNSRRHGGRVTRVDINCARDGDDLLITIADDGIGIQADRKETIFVKEPGSDRGLGLFLARQILAITGILIRETGTPGKGARFEIVVPEGRYRAGV